ncbi:XRE family transcriptional regulator [Klebsiella quasipneumoniae]|nr:XRE family transcriptional regulator [Klebsiella quasipneumoniae]
MMNVKPIRTEQDYEAALSAVELFLIMNLRRTRRKGIFLR